MDRRERQNDYTEALRTLWDGRQAQLWTTMPGIIQSFDADKMTVEVQVAIQGTRLFPDGHTENITISVCPDVPVVFPGAGGWTLTFPIQQGDECLVVFASRCIDAWWQSGGIQPQAESRMHDLSDGFALVGVRSQPRKLDPAVSTTKTELRNDAGDVKITLVNSEIDVLVKDDTSIKVTDGQIEMTAKDSMMVLKEGTIEATTTLFKINGKLTVTEDVSMGGGAQFVKLADGSNATKVKAT